MGFKPVTLPISGEVVLVQPVSPLLLAKLRKRYPPPEPPVQQVNYGTVDNPQYQQELNESHPEYLKALQEWKVLLEERSRLFAIRLGTKIEWTDERKEAVEAFRAGMRAFEADSGESLDTDEEDDATVFISYIAVQGSKDYETLLRAVIEGSRPSEEGIKDAVASFRPDANGQGADVPGEGRIQHQGTS